MKKRQVILGVNEHGRDHIDLEAPGMLTGGLLVPGTGFVSGTRSLEHVSQTSCKAMGTQSWQSQLLDSPRRAIMPTQG